jgi:hypothetical protein
MKQKNFTSVAFGGVKNNINKNFPYRTMMGSGRCGGWRDEVTGECYCPKF